MGTLAEVTSKGTRPRISDAERKEALRMAGRKKGLTYSDLSEKLGITYGRARRIVLGLEAEGALSYEMPFTDKERSRTKVWFTV